MQQVRRWAGVAGLLVILAGCTYQAALRQLPPEEQVTFRMYSKVMTSHQTRTYLSKATAAERAAYLAEIGVAQRFQALEPQDRETVRSGFPRQGMSAEALRFLWGEPDYTNGNRGHYEYWHYLGSAFSLGERGSALSQGGTIMTVYLVDNRVNWWRETVPTPQETESGDKRKN
jgi:hypothetical protein